MQTHNKMQAPSSIQLPLTEVIRLILQFLKQQKFTEAFRTLQQQSKISLNIIKKHQIQEIILNSNWQSLFKELNYLSLSEDLLFDIYELLLDDLIDKDGFEASKFVIKRCLQGKFGIQYKERMLRLQYICYNPTQKPLYHKPPTLIRKQSIINRILKQTYQEVQQSRLLTLITSGLKYQSNKGLITPNLSYSLLEGRSKNIENQCQKLISKIDKILKYNQQTRITSLAISNKGQYIALGGIDGLIQIYQPIEYTLQTQSLKYQGEGVMLYHQNSIEHLIFNQTDELLLSSDHKNVIKVWSMETGRLLRKIQNQSVIGCCSWGIDSSQILIGYQNIQLWGIRGCNILKQYICSTGNNNQQFLLDVAVCSNNVQGTRIYSFGQLGTFRMFNYKTQQQSKVTYLNSHNQQNGQILKIIYKPPATSSVDQSFYVATSKFLINLNGNLEQISKYQITGSGDRVSLNCIGVAQHYIYQFISKDTQKGRLNELGQYVYQVRQKKTGKIVHSKGIEGKAQIVQVHPWRNLVISYGMDDVLTFWRP